MVEARLPCTPDARARLYQPKFYLLNLWKSGSRCAWIWEKKQGNHERKPLDNKYLWYVFIKECLKNPNSFQKTAVGRAQLDHRRAVASFLFTHWFIEALLLSEKWLKVWQRSGRATLPLFLCSTFPPGHTRRFQTRRHQVSLIHREAPWGNLVFSLRWRRCWLE